MNAIDVLAVSGEFDVPVRPILSWCNFQDADDWDQASSLVKRTCDTVLSFSNVKQLLLATLPASAGSLEKTTNGRRMEGPKSPAGIPYPGNKKPNGDYITEFAELKIQSPEADMVLGDIAANGRSERSQPSQQSGILQGRRVRFNRGKISMMSFLPKLLLTTSNRARA